MRSVSLIAGVLLVAAGAAVAQSTTYPNPDGTYPNPDGTQPAPEYLKVRTLVDGFLTLNLQGRVAWLEIESGAAPPAAAEPTFFMNGASYVVKWAANATHCPCRSQEFPTPFAEGVPADAVGMIHYREGRGESRVLEQPADGRGRFRVGIDDAPFEGAAWYALAVGPDPAFREECRTTYPDGSVGPCQPAPYCPAPPPESRNWTEEQRKAWAASNCSAPPPPDCPMPPPEARNWTEEQKRAWAEANCKFSEPTGCPPPPPEASTWTEEQRKAWAAKYCTAPPPTSCTTYGSTTDPRTSTYPTSSPTMSWGAPSGTSSSYPSSSGGSTTPACPTTTACTVPALPAESRNWTEDQKRAYYAVSCPTMSGGTGGDAATDTAAKAAEALAANETLREAARKAAENTTGQKIVVPGFAPLAALAGLGVVGAIAGRRR